MNTYIKYVKHKNGCERMKKRLIIGIMLCVFVLVSLPSINALECNTLIGKRESDNFKKIKSTELFSMINDLENDESPKMFFASSLLVAAIALSIVIAVLIYIYVSGFIVESIEFPSMSFVKDDAQDTITVASTDANVLWSDIDIQGECNTLSLSGYVTVGDVITECNGEIRIIHIPSNAILGIFDFN